MSDEVDGIDIYLGRCLKNWAAQYQPPADARDTLLQQAALSSAHQGWGLPAEILRRSGVRKSAHAISWQRRLDGFFISVYRPTYRSRGEVIWGPIVQSQLFFATHSWGWRLAH
jgi:hypothetical protein